MSKRPFICGVRDDALTMAAGRVCKWPRGYRILWSVHSPVPGFTTDDMYDLYSEIWENLNQIAHLPNAPNRPKSPANIEISSRRIDGFGGVLAQARLPCGRVTDQTRLSHEIDTGEDWVVAANPSSRKMDLLRVGTHELIHNLGIGHVDRGVAQDIMNPSVGSIRVVKQRTWSANQLVDRYGAPKQTEPDEPDPPTGASNEYYLTMPRVKVTIDRAGRASASIETGGDDCRGEVSHEPR